MQPPLRIIGIDAAFANTGVAIGTYDVNAKQIKVSELDLFQTTADKANKKVVRKNSDDLRRTAEILRGLDRVIAEYDPQFAFCEVPFGAQSARAAWSLGIALGVIAHVASKVPLIQVTPKEVKDVVGQKFPDKAEMIAWASSTYPDVNWPVKGGKIVAGKAEHMADAIASIHAGVETDEFRRVVSILGMR